MTTTEPLTGERKDLQEILARHRFFLRYTVQGLTDDQARQRTTASQCTLGALIKHVTSVEDNWVSFILDGADAMSSDPQAWQDNWTMLPTDTLDGLLARYDEVTTRSEQVLRTVDLDQEQELPKQPWFEPGAAWSARRVFMHILAETSQHAGHADIIRESLDGQKTMG